MQNCWDSGGIIEGELQLHQRCVFTFDIERGGEFKPHCEEAVGGGDGCSLHSVCRDDNLKLVTIDADGGGAKVEVCPRAASCLLH